MAVGSRFRRGTGSHGWGLKGGRWPFLGEERMAERWQRACEQAAAVLWPSGWRRKTKGVGQKGRGEKRAGERRRSWTAAGPKGEPS
jgi:hypothetical protein